jgi:hypothetical protein
LGAIIIVLLFRYLAQKQKDDKDLWDRALVNLTSAVSATNVELVRLVTLMSDSVSKQTNEHGVMLRTIQEHDAWEKSQEIPLHTLLETFKITKRVKKPTSTGKKRSTHKK